MASEASVVEDMLTERCIELEQRISRLEDRIAALEEEERVRRADRDLE